ncbi:hypothetical protein ACHWQZ_G008114 [Mnemiopsis leidyi]
MTQSEESSQPAIKELIKAKSLEFAAQLPYADVAQEKATVFAQWYLNKDYFTMGTVSGLACCLSHPLDLVKVRFQLQGELRPPGKYTVKYQTVPQSLAAIVRDSGVRGLYKGFPPAFIYQFLMNTVRMFVFEKCNKWGLTSDLDEEPVLWRYAAACALSGSAGAVVASTAYLAKIQTQSQASEKLAVGWQHNHVKARWVVWNAFRGHRGYLGSGFQGGTSAVMRVSVASTVQLLSFTTIQHGIYALGVHDAILNSCISGVISAMPVVLISNPLDVICTRMYNQELGAYYKSNRECAEKLFQREGLQGFYKGAVANYCRTVPHMVVSLLLWDHLRKRSFDFSQINQLLSNELREEEQFKKGHKEILSKFES